jgi:hypothetical protein
MAIRKFPQDYSGEEDADLYGKAKRLIGVGDSGISNLGQYHRKYLFRTTVAVRLDPRM